MTWDSDLPRYCEFCGDPLCGRQARCCSKDECQNKMRADNRKKWKKRPQNVNYFRDYARVRAAKRKANLEPKTKRKGGKKIYLAKDVPRGTDLWQCQDPLKIGCKTWSDQRLTCRECQRKLSKRQLSQQYPDIIYMDAGENLAVDFEIRNPEGEIMICVQHRLGWCATEKKTLQCNDHIKTLCDEWVICCFGIKKREPTCEECKVRLNRRKA